MGKRKTTIEGDAANEISDLKTTNGSVDYYDSSDEEVFFTLKVFFVRFFFRI